MHWSNTTVEWKLPTCFVFNLTLFLKFLLMYVVDLQCCISFKYKAKWFSYTHICIYTYIYIEVKRSEVAQSCLTLCDPMDYNLPGSSVYGIFQGRVLEWVAISFYRGYSWPRDQTRVSHIVGRRFTVWATREAYILKKIIITYILFLFIYFYFLGRTVWHAGS